MRARGLLIFVLLNVAISIGVALAVISLLGPQESAASQIAQVTIVEVVVTATQGPSQTPFVITATPRAGEIPALPPGVLDPTPPGQAAAVAATIDPTALAADPSLASISAESTALPDGCITHVLASGESPAFLAVTYGTDVNSILLANGLDEESARFLQIGQELIVPLEGCPLDRFVAEAALTQTAVALAPTATLAPDQDTEGEGTQVANAGGTSDQTTVTPSVTPTITLAPTATNAQVEIREIFAAGDLTAEAVILFNNGRSVDLAGWTLSDLDGNEYVFPEMRLFNDSSIELLTRAGTDLPYTKYWGRSEAIWQPGDVATLRDAAGNIQSIYRIPVPVNLN